MTTTSPAPTRPGTTAAPTGLPGSPPSRPAPVLRAGVPVLRRGRAGVQVGWDPDRALLLEPAAATDGAGLVELLRSLDGSRGATECARAAARLGIAPEEWEAVLVGLRAAGLLAPAVPAPATVLVHGDGPLAAMLARWLPGPATSVRRSHDRLPGWPDDAAVPDLVVLADSLVTEPWVSAELVACRVAHLPVLLRDGTGLVGPLVLPGRSPCLRCTDLQRRDLDPGWPLVAAQLLGRTGAGRPAVVRATAALACAQVEAALAPPGGPAPTSLGATVTVDLDHAGPRRRVWRPHPDCGCGAWA